MFDTQTTGAVAEIATQIADLQAHAETEDQRDAAEPGGATPAARLARLIDVSAVANDAEITEPVTSGGNPALWVDPAPPVPPAGAKP